MKLIFFFLFTSIAFSQSPVPAGAKLEKLATGLLQPEGPLWKDGVGLLFSDLRSNKIYKWSPVDSLLQVFLDSSETSNGLTFDQQGRLVLTQMAMRRVSRQEPDRTITVLASKYNGKRFNSPNDIVVKSDGAIFFTDPDNNIPTGQSMELTFRGIFRISTTNSVTLLDSTVNKPNGICFSLDEKKLYVDDSNNIYAWDVVNDSTLAHKQLFYHIPAPGYTDGMKIDAAGNIYCTGPNGVWIVSPSGTGLGIIAMTLTPSNCAWGDADRKTLYITAGYNSGSNAGDVGIYRIRLASTTGVRDHGSLNIHSNELYANYPNPFNPATVISYQISAISQVSLKVYDVLGREVEILVSERQSEGSHLATFNANNLPSGVYFYRLQAGSFTQTKKLLLIK
jgi:gluconolactonase